MKRDTHGGFLLAIEGIDGAGKTTQARLVAAELSRKGFDVVCTKEPTNGSWGQRIRGSADTGRMSPEDELEAFIADRREHVDQFIRPALAQNKVVIVDRYYFSNAAYQGARGLSPDEIIRRNEEFAPVPDFLAILDATPTTGLQRVHARGDTANLFEDQGLLSKSRALFLSMAIPARAYVTVLDASLPESVIMEKIVAVFHIHCANRISAAESMTYEQKLEAAANLFNPNQQATA